MPGGYIFAILFFILLALAALNSTISVLETVVAYFSEELKMTRKKATLVATFLISILGVVASASLGWFSGLTLSGTNIFGVLNYASANLLLPV